MKGDTQVILMVLFFVGGFGLCLFLLDSKGTVTADDIANPLATLIAAFVGAWVAFKLQWTHQKNIETESITKCLKMRFTIVKY